MSSDPYCYPGTNVLKNLLDIHADEELKRMEAQVASIALLLLRQQPLRLPFNEARLKATHKFIFGEIYAWAGTYRAGVGRMTKGRTLGYTVTYGDSAFVAPEIQRIFRELAAENYLAGLDLDPFAERVTYFYSEIDSTHPFREGNSRTLRQFFEDLARGAGFLLDWEASGLSQESKNALYHARDQAYQVRRYEPLRTIIRQGLSPLQP